MAEHFIIDGYNVLHRSKGLSRAADVELELGREILIDRVAQYCVSSGIRATIVFDGRGIRNERESGVRGSSRLDVIYAAADRSADAIIERMIYNHPRRREAVAVTGDRGISDLCIGLGSLAMTPEAFWKTLDEETERVRSSVERSRSDASMARLEEGLNKSSVERLDALRRRLESRGD